MAHVQMHQAHDDGGHIMDPLIKRRSLEQEKHLTYFKEGMALQRAMLNADTELEKSRINAKKDIYLSKYRAGWDAQFKKWGLDLDLELQKLRNLNVMDKAEFDRKTALMVEKLKNENVQSQIVKTYQTNLKLANYNAKQALYRTYLDTFGDIVKNGDPATNAVDALLYTAFVAAFAHAGEFIGLDKVPERGKQSEFNSDRDIINNTTNLGKGVKDEELSREIEEYRKFIKELQEGKPGKITRNAKLGKKAEQQLKRNKWAKQSGLRPDLER